MGTKKKKTVGKPGASKSKEIVPGKVKITAQSKPISHARFDARLTQKQKDLFEQAAAIKGFKSLTEFVIHYTSEAAIFIIERHNAVLTSEKDKAIFFDALVNPPKPNAALVKATKHYNEQVASK
jgi:uncharacterized protein (DUF1778 family)